jgi:hypothetical protein
MFMNAASTVYQNLPTKRNSGIRPICLKTNLEAFAEMPAKALNGISTLCQKKVPRRHHLVPEKDSAASP